MPHHLYFVSKKKYLSPVQTEFRDFILAANSADANRHKKPADQMIRRFRPLTK